MILPYVDKRKALISEDSCNILFRLNLIWSLSSGIKVTYVADGERAVRVRDLVGVIELNVFFGKRLNSHRNSLPQVSKWVPEEYILDITL